MKFLIAPNALKGSLSSSAAAIIISKVLREIYPDADCVLRPIADGGNGTLDCLIQASQGRIYSKKVSGPLASMKVDARWGILGDGKTAVIEMAEAAGLHLLKPNQYDAANATTYGVGELILAAMSSECTKIIVGLGGSATTDGGAGCARALGVKFFDEKEEELAEGGTHLIDLRSIQIKETEGRRQNTEIIGLADVKNILYGGDGTALTFAAQKGATKEQARLLDKALEHYGSIINGMTHRDVSHIPGSGAAGGLGAGLIAFCDATIVSGIDFILDTIHFDDLLRQCDCVITTEGKLDLQTLQGKGIDGIARRAKQFNKPVFAFAGRVTRDKLFLKQQLGLAELIQISPENLSVEEAIGNAESFLSRTVREHFSKTN
jgi:glycerate kinase